MTRLSELFGARDRQSVLEPLSVIDIGSNSVRLVVYEGAVRSPTPLFNEKILCGLGRTIATTGRLGKEGVERAIAALRRFHAVNQVLQVKYVRAFATAAVREAADGADFIARSEKAAGCKIDILSGADEARLAAQGIMMGFVDPDGMAGDLGGGSLEVIDVGNDKLKNAATLPLGGLRLIDTTGDRIEKALTIADEELAALPWLDQGRGRSFYAVGGTWRALGKLHMEQSDYPLRVMHNYALPAREAIAFCEMIRKARKISALPGIETVARARREVLPYGALVLERLLKRLQAKDVVFSVFGVREGLIYGLLPAYERRRDPLLSFCEDYASLRSRSVDHAHELCRWTDPLFDREDLIETPEERRLRHATCLISDVGWRAHPDYRGEQSLNMLAHSGIAGVDHPGRVFLALSIYYRHEASDRSGTDLSERLKDLVSKRAQKRARIIGSAIRAAHMLSIGMSGVIDETPVSHDRGKLVLKLPPTYAALDGERFRRRFETLAALVGSEPEVRLTRS